MTLAAGTYIIILTLPLLKVVNSNNLNFIMLCQPQHGSINFSFMLHITITICTVTVVVNHKA